MRTWGALAIPFSPCLSRKSKSWEHGARLGFPFPPACRGKGNHGNMAMRLRFLFPLPVEETAIMGLWHALAIPFSPCLSRKRQSWGACDSLFPLPVEEKAIVGCLRFAFPPASRGTGLDGPSEARSLRLPKAFMKCLEPQRLRKRSKWPFHRQVGEKAIMGLFACGAFLDALFIDRQGEKGWRPPK